MVSSKFSSLETKLYLFVWSSAVVYSVYKFTLTIQIFFQGYEDYYGDFTEGWQIFKFRRLDRSDFEWETINYTIKRCWVVQIINVTVCEIFQWLHLPGKQWCQIALVVIYLLITFHPIALAIILLQPLVFRLCCKTWQIWTVASCYLLLIATYKTWSATEEFANITQMNVFDIYLTVLIASWMTLKCITACHIEKFDNYLQYCFYLPTLFSGPHITVEEFTVRKLPEIKQRLLRFSWDLFKVVVWWTFTQGALHFVYVNAAALQLNLVENLDFTSLCGMGYAMGQFFHLKYTVSYGLSSALARFQGINPPNLPKCIGRIHLYSQMWKYFDPGLYEFLKLSIYIPVTRKCPKSFASFVCFTFVYVWHGLGQSNILIWASINYLGILIENWAIKLKIHNSTLRSMAAAPLLACSAISNFYFFAGTDVGNVFVLALINETIANRLTLLVILYCCCQVSTELQ